MFEKYSRPDRHSLARAFPYFAAAAIALIAAVPSSAATIFNFDFENDEVGQTTAFTDISNGLAASFEDAGPVAGSFMVLPSIFSTLQGNALYSLLPDGVLRITFSQNIYGLSLLFALGSSGEIRMRTFDADAVPAVHTQVAGVVEDGGPAYEGTLAVSAAAGIRQVELSSTAAGGFAVDNLEPVPEAATLLQLAGGLGLLVAAWCRRKRSGSFLTPVRAN